VVIWAFKKIFKISANIPNEVRNINEPYLLLANHYGRYDPFIISDFIKRKPNFISSDAILRDRFYGRIFRGLGAIPKKKGVRDSHVIREMKKVVDRGGAIALFPEATRTWSGVTNYIDPSIAKLAKLFKVPVVTAKMKGGYAFDPRWARPLRKAQIEIDYEIALTKEQLKVLNSEEVMDIITTKLDHDDIAYARERQIKIKSNHRAEYIERMLFQCPDCYSIGGFNSAKNSFSCNTCKYTIDIDEYGFFTSKGKVHFDNPRDWLNWQNQDFVNNVIIKLKEDVKSPWFHATEMEIQEAVGEGSMTKKGIGKVSFYSDKIQVSSANFNTELFHKDITSLSPQFKERIELFHQDKAYRFLSTQHQEPSIKWELAINAVWSQTDQDFKLSPYFKHLFEE
jgi:1-acyl-sn-glycerol-3-phosphate acyltransferase